MKVIFLDIDGVLNVIPEGHDEFGSLFHKHFEDNLRMIIDETSAKIVISSTWRFNGLIFIRDMWQNRNLPGEVIDITTFTWQAKTDQIYERCERGNEIQVWLDDHPEVTSYCIIDDDTDMLASQKKYLVKTSGNTHHDDCVDIGYGLTKECARMAIDILNFDVKEKTPN